MTRTDARELLCWLLCWLALFTVFTLAITFLVGVDLRGNPRCRRVHELPEKTTCEPCCPHGFVTSRN